MPLHLTAALEETRFNSGSGIVSSLSASVIRLPLCQEFRITVLYKGRTSPAKKCSHLGLGP